MRSAVALLWSDRQTESQVEFGGGGNPLSETFSFTWASPFPSTKPAQVPFPTIIHSGYRLSGIIRFLSFHLQKPLLRQGERAAACK